MAITQNTYTGDGSTVLYSFSFPYLESTDIKVSLNGTITTAYTLANATTIQFNTPPSNGSVIRIYRQTDDENLTAQFYPGAAIRAQDLNNNFTQSLYLAQDTATAQKNLEGVIYTRSELDNGQLDNRYYTEIELNSGQLDNRYYTETELNSGQLDNRYFTESETLSLINDVGGFVPIASYLSFPTANPDPSDNEGTVVSLLSISGLTHSSGNSLNAETTSGATVTITGIPSTLPSPVVDDFGMLVVTTSTLNCYSFHRLIAPATDVVDVANNILDVVSVANNESDIDTVAGNIGRVNIVGADLANNFTAVSDYGVITDPVTSTSGNSRVKTVADNISNVNTVAGISGSVTSVANNTSSVNTVAANNTNITTVATSIANVNTTGNNISSVNTAASNIAAIIAAPTEASNAANSASAALTSQINAVASANAAATSATNAATSASSAANSASAAATSEANAASSASTAATSATNAQASENVASSSAAAAAVSETNAANSEVKALQYRDDTAGLLTQAGSDPYNVATNQSWGDLISIIITHFANEGSNILLTMSKGTNTYNYGTII